MRHALTILCIACILIGYLIPWTGFGEFTKPSADYQRAKTFWDWLSLFVVPFGLGLAGATVAYLLNSRQKERELTSQTNRFREEALQKYFDHMTQLMLKEGTSTLNSTAHVQNIARYRTLTVLRELDGERRATLLRFLYESQLIARGQRIVHLDDADLSETNLSGINLQDANLEKVNLSGANLSKADLRGASLYGADLSRANLRGAKLAQADLGGTNLSEADLTDAEEYTNDQLLKASVWRDIKPTDLEKSLSRPGESAARPRDDLRSWLSTTQWLKRTDHISHKTTLEYEDENETHGRWLVTRGRHQIEPLKDFHMGIYLVTNELFLQFVQNKGYESGNSFWEGVPS